MSASQRTKGANGERELCHLLEEAFGQVVKRKLGQARDSGHDIDLPPFHIECKRRKRFAGLYEWIAQAGRTYAQVIHEDGCIRLPIMHPVVALRADGKEWLVVMRLTDWCKLAREEIAK